MWILFFISDIFKASPKAHKSLSGRRRKGDNVSPLSVFRQKMSKHFVVRADKARERTTARRLHSTEKHSVFPCSRNSSFRGALHQQGQSKESAEVSGTRPNRFPIQDSVRPSSHGRPSRKRVSFCIFSASFSRTRKNVSLMENMCDWMFFAWNCLGRSLFMLRSRNRLHSKHRPELGAQLSPGRCTSGRGEFCLVLKASACGFSPI